MTVTFSVAEWLGCPTLFRARNVNWSTPAKFGLGSVRQRAVRRHRRRAIGWRVHQLVREHDRDQPHGADPMRAQLRDEQVTLGIRVERAWIERPRRGRKDVFAERTAADDGRDDPSQRIDAGVLSAHPLR